VEGAGETREGEELMVSYEATRRKYRGKMASGYEAKRRRQIRWSIENATVEQMLSDLRPGATLLDCPVGTGRFTELYLRRGIAFTGVDASSEMLDLAREKLHLRTVSVSVGGKSTVTARVQEGDATKLDFKSRSFDVAVCVRFLDLIDDETMRRVVRELTRVARRRIVLTIRLGEKYAPKVNTATHNDKKFRSLISLSGWEIAEEIPIFGAGWVVMRLERKKENLERSKQ